MRKLASHSPFADAPERVEIERELEAGEQLLWPGRPHHVERLIREQLLQNAR